MTSHKREDTHDEGGKYTYCFSCKFHDFLHVGLLGMRKKEMKNHGIIHD
jgi:hypothetical protein